MHFAEKLINNYLITTADNYVEILAEKSFPVLYTTNATFDKDVLSFSSTASVGGRMIVDVSFVSVSLFTPTLNLTCG